METSFATSEPLTLGVELELQLVDWRSYDLVPAAPRILSTLGSKTERIKPEIFRAMIEINTGICRDVADVRRDLVQSLRHLHEAAAAHGVEVVSAGTHPFGLHSERLFYPSDRYAQLLERNAWIARRLLIFGLHVHVGMRSGDHAIATMNALSRYLGHLLALSASSPFWAGEDTGLASSRITIFEAIPTAGTPPSFDSWADLEAFASKMVASGSVGSMKDFWWDIRPSPGFGTLEVRICDSPATLDEILSIVALVQCLAAAADDRIEAGERQAAPPAWLLRENKWRAARHGLDAAVLVDDEARSVRLRDHIPELVRSLDAVARRHRCERELAQLVNMLERGTASERQRAVRGRTHSLPAVVEMLAEGLRDSVRE